MTISSILTLIAFAAVIAAAYLLQARMLRKEIAKRDTALAGIRTRLEADHGIRVDNAHIEAAWKYDDGAVKLATFSDGSLREVLLRGRGQDLVAYYGSDERWNRFPVLEEAGAR